jgi:hypothetical protein
VCSTLRNGGAGSGQNFVQMGRHAAFSIDSEGLAPDAMP